MIADNQLTRLYVYGITVLSFEDVNSGGGISGNGFFVAEFSTSDILTMQNFATQQDFGEGELGLTGMEVIGGQIVLSISHYFDQFLAPPPLEVVDMLEVMLFTLDLDSGFIQSLPGIQGEYGRILKMRDISTLYLSSFNSTEAKFSRLDELSFLVERTASFSSPDVRINGVFVDARGALNLAMFIPPNGVLVTVEVGLSQGLFGSGRGDAFVVTMQRDTLFMTGSDFYTPAIQGAEATSISFNLFEGRFAVAVNTLGTTTDPLLTHFSNDCPNSGVISPNSPSFAVSWLPSSSDLPMPATEYSENDCRAQEASSIVGGGISIRGYDGSTSVEVEGFISDGFIYGTITRVADVFGAVIETSGVSTPSLWASLSIAGVLTWTG